MPKRTTNRFMSAFALISFLPISVMTSMTTQNAVAQSTVPLTPAEMPVYLQKLPVITELPDPFLKANGKRISSIKEWNVQRKHLLDLTLQYEYGKLPPEEDPVSVEAFETRSIVADKGIEEFFVLHAGPEGAVQSRLFISRPVRRGRYPVIVVGDMGWGRVKPEIVEEVVKRGYVLAEFNREEIAPDKAGKGGLYDAFPNYDGGRLSAWAWGYHRVVDYLCTQSYIDKSHIVITGHSRGGKATLLAGATDTRVALTVPNNSGCGGAGGYRVQASKSEDIVAITKNFPYWFQPHFRDFIGHIDQLPIDQHIVKSLIAPRALLTTEALGDLWANPMGSQQTYEAAKEVYRYLGADDKIGIVYRSGGHEQGLQDWITLLDFADKLFFEKDIKRDFDQRTFKNLPSAYSWMMPNKGEKR